MCPRPLELASLPSAGTLSAAMSRLGHIVCTLSATCQTTVFTSSPGHLKGISSGELDAEANPEGPQQMWKTCSINRTLLGAKMKTNDTTHEHGRSTCLFQMHKAQNDQLLSTGLNVKSCEHKNVNTAVAGHWFQEISAGA